MRFEDIRKRLIKESLIVGGAVAVLTGAVYYFSDVGDSYQQESAALQNQVSSTHNETVRLQDMYTKVKKNNALYQEALAKRKSGQLTIGRKSVRVEVEGMHSRYYLNPLRLTMSPIRKVAGSEYDRKTASIESSDVNLTYEALSDEYIYGALQAMQKELPGSTRIDQLTLKEAQPLTSEVLQTIKQKGSFPLVTGDLKFTWFGLTSTESSSTNETASQQK